MKIAVEGLWHLGSVTSACMADAGFTVAGFDPDTGTIAGLKAGKAAIHEPNLNEILSRNIAAGRLTFHDRREEAFRDCDVLWITYDTPVDENDVADVEFVTGQVRRSIPYLKPGTLVLISAQLPVGTTAALESWTMETCPDAAIAFAVSPENLRLGRAVEAFLRPERVVVGFSDARSQDILACLFGPITDNILFMSVESAEMAKHALNAYLATTITLVNELATICEITGADAVDVESALRSDPRVGVDAYVHPGAAFAGGTLARDIMFLGQLSQGRGLETPLLDAIPGSNRAHSNWWENQLSRHLGNLKGRVVALLGLTYKPGTDTLRRSQVIVLCRRLSELGARVQAHDPSHPEIPEELAFLVVGETVTDALVGAEAAVIATPWPEFREINADIFVNTMKNPLVIDQNRFLEVGLAEDPRITFVALGRAVKS